MILQRIYAEINLDKIRKNIEAVRRKVGKGVKIMAIVKADAYGHGAMQIAKSLADDDGICFGVATAAEALQLRRAGIQNLILILGPVFEPDFAPLIENNISMTVFEADVAREISAVAVTLQKAARLHIAVDTGMGRIGMQAAKDSLPVLAEIAGLPYLETEGIFTHFACADEADKTSCLQQKALFLQFIEMAKQIGVEFSIRHMCNSAAIIDFDGDYLDMVRSGIITYGMYPSEQVHTERMTLYPAMEIKSHVSFVKTVGKNFTVSYGSTYRTERETTIATVPVGYADGYPRALSSKGYVLIHGKKAPILGRVCMDQLMVDVTEIPHVCRKDTVTLLGQDGQEQISMESLSALAGSFNYEFSCGIAKRVPRVYLQNGKILCIEDALD